MVKHYQVRCLVHGPSEKNTNTLPPILIEVQYSENMHFYRAFIDYGLLITKKKTFSRASCTFYHYSQYHHRTDQPCFRLRRTPLSFGAVLPWMEKILLLAQFITQLQSFACHSFKSTCHPWALLDSAKAIVTAYESK